MDSLAYIFIFNYGTLILRPLLKQMKLRSYPYVFSLTLPSVRFRLLAECQFQGDDKNVIRFHNF